MLRSLRIGLFWFLVCVLPLTVLFNHTGGGKAAANSSATVAHIIVDGPISPVSADYIEKQVEKAQADGFDLVVLQLDTPGGLVTSTRQIVKVILGSRIPVAVYVAPPGARAASAGVFITMSGHVAAMAPGTNIGAAHPVNMGGGNPLMPKKEEEPETEKKENSEPGNGETDPSTGSGQGKEKSATPAKSNEDVMGQKVLNDTVAFARSIAEKQGRNADWAERAVRESVSVTETEALELNVIDIIAEDMDELLAAMDGMTVTISGEEVVLAVKGGTVVERPMGFRHRVLSALSDPNVAYILMMLGIYGLFFELANPGVVLPGVLGGIFLILAFFSFQVIPINYAGFLLIFLAITLFILEVKVVSYGMLSLGGVVALFLGSMMLFDTGEPYLKLSISLVLAFTITTALFVVFGLALVIKSHKKQPTTGVEGMVGERGIASTDISPTGKVKVHGEIWAATSKEGIKAGEPIVVRSVRGMMLQIDADKDEQ